MKSWPSLSHRWLPQHSHLSLKWTENFRQLVTGIELRPEMHWRNVAAKGVQSGWGKTPSLDVSGELEDVKLWWHTVSQTDLAARPEGKIFNDPALGTKETRKHELGCWYQKSEAGSTSLRQKLGSNSQQYPHHPLKQGNEFCLLCTLFLKTMPADYLAERDILDIFRTCAFLKCILAKHTFKDCKDNHLEWKSNCKLQRPSFFQEWQLLTFHYSL